ncbi:hypothetical protein A2W54_01265 [Candidatus Giovannonibacteria bacterium RIFCSPHIGHO2_02_43_13]|uniref:Peptidoglycan binding-like domain-containing protein n=1 Tax=Candidatus Giovannonibacteria bacterium RIFCSPHIGHO2_02_43_13 TaxID=1798330 RepID=A0A1F5WUP0_9BACT|nr:MAG: hypothetical protein UW28_C0001G0012 [Parcubacteria group bacterium GW2011_GWA2_44_13]OGF72971.1 MAG: hypothetical protein A3E06_03250 [Candidatus Giovannonibacteria bacterium RIFCSPHIGHO2_12_FULL_44_42]OGF79344.1 MAG: hypothetical protein A2W54_01265 [Candidatus Giovannonibacteria bacterium RIFCSPHIGHO2_02_43_13]OGF90269.1 MAG: hypothetical protein A3I94_01585 [Candidatus Giovannonibacteria bacterium RIFCSPLOWO2_02_FULL_43_54]OGF97251.1 MAG: hypothetical protein A3H08_02755 [Candidatus
MQAGQGSQSQWCHDFYVNLRVGDRGNDVSALQHALNLDLGQIVEETGYFGEDTASAVTGLQEKYRGEILTPNGLRYGTGFAGSSTRKKLNQLYGCGVELPYSTPMPPYPTPYPTPFPTPPPINN